MRAVVRVVWLVPYLLPIGIVMNAGLVVLGAHEVSRVTATREQPGGETSELRAPATTARPMTLESCMPRAHALQVKWWDVVRMRQREPSLQWDLAVVATAMQLAEARLPESEL